MSRGFFGTRILLSESGASSEVPSALGAAVAAIMMLSPIGVLVVVGAYVALGALPGGFRAEEVGLVAVVAIATPLVCVQDALRFGALRSGRPQLALASDASWLVCVVVALFLGADKDPLFAIGAWAVSALVALVVVYALVRPTVDFAQGRQLLRLQWGVE
jgi:hypothetical protein